MKSTSSKKMKKQQRADKDRQENLQRQLVRSLQATLAELKSNWNEETNQPRLVGEDIAEVVAMWTGIPVMRMASRRNRTPDGNGRCPA